MDGFMAFQFYSNDYAAESLTIVAGCEETALDNVFDRTQVSDVLQFGGGL
jgi:hypothetical protein